MPVFKLTMMLTNDWAQGWSESYYTEQADMGAAIPVLDTLVPLLMSLRTAQNRMLYARASDVSIRGDSQLSTLSFPYVGTYSPSLGVNAISADVGLLVQLFASSKRKNHVFMRGMSDDIITGLVFNSEPAWQASFDFLNSELTADCKTQTRISPTNPTKQYDNILSVFVVGVHSRKPGRPFGLPVGRRKRR